MKFPILYPQGATDFSTLGLGPMNNTIKAAVPEERNGSFYFEATVVIDDVIYPQLQNDMLIKADAGHELKDQRFRIKRITDNHDGTAKIYAEHISYLASELSLKPTVNITNANATTALNVWKTNIIDPNPFTVTSNISTISSTSWRLDKVANARQALGGVEGSVLDTWGGEYLFDNYRISLLSKRGKNANVVLAYGRNIIDFEQERNIANTYNAVYPFALYTDDKQVEHMVTLSEYFVDASNIDSFPNRKALPVDFSSEFENDEVPTQAKLRSLATSYITANEIGVPTVSIKVSFLDLSKTADYKEIAPLEELNLCDDVRVFYPKLGVNTVAKVIRTVWNVLTESYDEIEIGEKRVSLSTTINQIQKQVKENESLTNAVMISADGKNKIFYGLFGEDGLGEPVAESIGDSWYKPNGTYEELYIWDGTIWKFIISTEELSTIQDKVDDLETDVQQAAETAENAANTANEAATKANNLEPIVNTANTNANTAVNNAQAALANSGTALTNAQAALNEANLAKAQSQQAIDKYTAMGMFPAWKMADGTFTKEYPNENLRKLVSSDWITREWSGWTVDPDSWLIMAEHGISPGDYISQTAEITNNGTTNLLLQIGVQSTANTTIQYINSPRVAPGETKVVTASAKIAANGYRLMTYGVVGDDGTTRKYAIYRKNKLEHSEIPTVYTVAPSVAASPDEYIPKYIGFCKEPSDNPDDYTWILNPDNVSGGVEIAITNINGELSQKVSQTTFDTLQGSVTAQATQINQNKTDIALKANQSTVDTLTGRVTTTEGSISTIAGQVALKANQTTVDTLSGKVSATESTLNTQAGQITALNTKTDGHTTQIGSLQSSYAGLSSTVSTVESNLNNLSVGGRNYLINTENPTSTNRVQLVGVAPVVVQTPTFIEGITRVEKTTENSNEMFYRFMGTNINNLSVTNLQHGETYTLGIDVRANLATTGKIYWRSQYRVGTGSWVNVDGWGTVPLEQTVNSSTFTRFEKALNIPANATTLYFSLQVYDSTGTIPIGTWFEFQKAKFELGNKATDHSPAPEDQATVVQLSNLTQTVNTLQGTVINNENNTQAQLTLLSDQMTSVVETLVPNMFSNSDFRSNATGWTNDTDVLRFATATSITKASVGSEVQAMTYISQASMGTKTSAYLFGPAVSDLTKIVGKKVRVSFWYYTGSYGSLTNSPVTAYVEYTTTTGQYYSVPFGTLPNKTGWTRVDKVIDLTNVTALRGFGIGLDVVKANFNGTSQTFYMTGFLLTTSEVLYDWGYATSKNAFYSQFTQLSSMLDLRVQKGDVLANITTEAGRVLIGAQSGGTGNYLMVTPTTTYIQDATIKSAMIESIVADKITAGTLNAANVNIINLNVDNLVGNKTSFVQSAWNSISSAVNVTAAGMTVSRSDGSISTIFQNDGIQIWGAGQWAGSLSWSSGPAVVLWAKTGHSLNLGYQGTNTASNMYSTAMQIDGFSGEVAVFSNIDFRLRRLGTIGYTTNGTWLFTRLSLNNVAGTALTNSQGNSGIWFGDNGYMSIRSRGTWYDMHTWLFGN